MLRRSTSNLSLFHHVFGINGRSLLRNASSASSSSSSSNATQSLLDNYLLRNGLTRSEWWTIPQAQLILQHDVEKDILSRFSSGISLPMFELSEQQLSSSNLKITKESNEKRDDTDNGTVDTIIPIDMNGMNEFIHHTLRPSSSSFVRAIREHLHRHNEEMNNNTNSHHQHLFSYSRISRNTLFLCYVHSQKYWKVIPSNDIFCSNNSSLLFSSSSSSSSQQVLDTTFKIRNVIRRELKQEDVKHEDTVPEKENNNNAKKQSADDVLLLDKLVGHLRFCLFETVSSSADSEKKDNENTTDQLLHLFPVEQLKPFSSIQVRAPPFCITALPSITPPLLLQKQISPESSDDNNSMKTAKEQAEEELKKMFSTTNSNKNGAPPEHQKKFDKTRPPPVVPVPLHPSAVATLISVQALNKYSSPIWIRLDEEGKKKPPFVSGSNEDIITSSKSSDDTSSIKKQNSSLIPSWLKERMDSSKSESVVHSPPAPSKNETRVDECEVQRVGSSNNNKLTPPPLPMTHQLFATKSPASHTVTVNPKKKTATSEDYINSLILNRKENCIDANNNIKTTTAAESSSSSPTLVSEHSETEAISLASLPEEILQAIPELRFIPKWVREEQEKILTGNNGHQDLVIGGNINSNNKKCSNNKIENSNNKKEVLVFGLFGPGFSLWKKVRKASIRRPQNHSAAFLFRNNNNNTSEIDEDDDSSLGNHQQQQQQQPSYFPNGGFSSHGNTNNRTGKWRNNSYKANKNNNTKNTNSRLFVTLSYLRHATTCKDLESIKHFIDPEELDPESLESFVSQQKRKNLLDSRKSVVNNNSNNEDEGSNNNNNNTHHETNMMTKQEENELIDDAAGKNFRRRGLGPLRLCLERHFAQSVGHTVASFPRQLRQIKYINFQQLANEIEKIDDNHTAVDEKSVEKEDAAAPFSSAEVQQHEIHQKEEKIEVSIQ